MLVSPCWRCEQNKLPYSGKITFDEIGGRAVKMKIRQMWIITMGNLNERIWHLKTGQQRWWWWWWSVYWNENYAELLLISWSKANDERHIDTIRSVSSLVIQFTNWTINTSKEQINIFNDRRWILITLKSLWINLHRSFEIIFLFARCAPSRHSISIRVHTTRVRMSFRKDELGDIDIFISHSQIWRDDREKKTKKKNSYSTDFLLIDRRGDATSLSVTQSEMCVCKAHLNGHHRRSKKKRRWWWWDVLNDCINK